MVINGNDSAVFYWGNKENSQMRSRTKWVVSALQWGRRLPGLRGCVAGFLLEIFPCLTSTPPPSPLRARHSCSGSNKSPAIAGADLLFISKCLKDKLWEGEELQRGSQGVKALVLGLKVDLAAPLGGCCTTLKKWMPIKPAVTDVWERLNCLVKKKDYGMSEENVLLVLWVCIEKKTNLNIKALWRRYSWKMLLSNNFRVKSLHLDVRVKNILF